MKSVMLEKYKLGKLVNVTRGASLSGDYYAEEGELIRLTLGNFDYKSNVFKENTSKKDIFYIGEVDDSFVLEKGDIITPLTEQAIGLLGSTARIPESGKYIQSQDVGLVKCISDKIDDSFLYYLLATPMVKQQLSAGAQQTSIRHTSPDKIKDCSVYIPDVESQRKIGKLLETLDRKIALNRKINAELEQMAKELYDYWFVQFDFPNAEGKPYKSSGGKMVYNPQLKRKIPEGWEVGCLDNYVEVRRGGSPRPINDYLSNDGLNWLKISDATSESSPFIFIIKDHIIKEGLTKTVYLEKGELVLSNSATPGLPKFLGVNSCIHDGWLYFPKSQFPKEFLYSFFLQIRESLVGQGNGSVFVNLKTDIIKALLVTRPPDEVLSSYYEKVRPIFDKIRCSASEVIHLTSLRDQLLPLLMNGQVTIE